MRTRTNIIIEESILAQIDAIAGEKNKRAAVIERALLEFIAREEKTEADKPKTAEMSEKSLSKNKGAGV